MFFIANWKMFGDFKSVNSIKKVVNLSKNKKYKKAKIVYCPPYTLINKTLKLVKNSNIQVGAQNCHYSQNPGPFNIDVQGNKESYRYIINPETGRKVPASSREGQFILENYKNTKARQYSRTQLFKDVNMYLQKYNLRIMYNTDKMWTFLIECVIGDVNRNYRKLKIRKL